MNKFIKITLSMVPFVLLCLVGVESVYQASKEQINVQQQNKLLEKLTQIFPLQDNEQLQSITLLINDYPKLPLLAEKTNKLQSKAWLVCSLEKQPQGMVFSLRTTQGYSGNIDVLMGVNHRQQITGVSILAHKETPGLGDKIEQVKSNWLEQFIGHSLASSSWQLASVSKPATANDFDAITAATITSKSIAHLLQSALMKLEHSELLGTKNLSCVT